MVEAGQTYDQLRGVSFEGTAEIVEDPDKLWAVGVSVWERYTGPYSEEVRPLVASMLHKRVAVRLVPTRIRSWDHRKPRCRSAAARSPPTSRPWTPPGNSSDNARPPR
ncbi:PPOX class probable F420-dependent enzyme [Mycobacteroides abscessus subsp. abscessus]|nr:PPOX class probable F420-dependent enzyme [Mycobacteroides abscessus subsp. abscessus]